MDRRVAILRSWVVFASCCALIVCRPDLAVCLWPVAFFIPGCFCCGCTDCSFCTGDCPTRYQIVITGLSGGCSVNGTYIVARNNNECGGGDDECMFWLAIVPWTCSVSGASHTMSYIALYHTAPGPRTVIGFLEVSGLCFTFGPRWQILSDQPTTCSGLVGYPIPFSLSDCSGTCASDGSSALLTAL